jgi:hypothetical protein
VISKHADRCGAQAGPLASYTGEKTLFQNEIKQINKFENFMDLATYLARKKESYLRHAQGFWGRWTKKECPGISWPNSDGRRKSSGKMMAWKRISTPRRVP